MLGASGAQVKDPSVIYDAAWFKKDFDHPGVREDFHLIADGIYRQFRPLFVHDYGCGPGMILERLLDHGVYVKGYEGSSHGVAHADERVRKFIMHEDLTTMKPYAGPASDGGLVICTEVAEHLEHEHADHLVDLLVAHMCPIIFTAAIPGQGGHDHVNEQPKEYWIDKFMDRGCKWDIIAEGELRARWHNMNQLHHMHRNLLVFV